MRKIDYRFKILYAFGMIFIVAGHTGYGGISIGYDWFPPYAFHLQLFLFASGYLCKEAKDVKFGNYVGHAFKKLIVPMYVWNLIYGIIVMLSRYAGFTIGKDITLENLIIAPLIRWDTFAYNFASWFVVPLFAVQVLVMGFRKLCARLKLSVNEIVLFVGELLIGISGVLLAQNGYRYGVWLFFVRIMYFLPFYGLGTLYKKKLEKYDRIPNLWYFAIIFAVQLAIITYYGQPLKYAAVGCDNFNENALMPFIVGIIGVAFWFRVVSILEPALKNSRCINTIADNSYAIMVHQGMGVMAVETIFAIIAKFTPLFSSFDMEMYKNTFAYFYLPNGVLHWLLVYMAAGIVVPMMIQTGVNRLKKTATSLLQNRKVSL